MSDEKIYPDHDPFCVIYKLGPEHCNCVQEDDDELGYMNIDYEEEFDEILL